MNLNYIYEENTNQPVKMDHSQSLFHLANYLHFFEALYEIELRRVPRWLPLLLLNKFSREVCSSSSIASAGKGGLIERWGIYSSGSRIRVTYICPMVVANEIAASGHVVLLGVFDFFLTLSIPQ